MLPNKSKPSSLQPQLLVTIDSDLLATNLPHPA
jgi:hypothetical protein